MAQSQEAQTFLDGISALPSGPGVSLDGVLTKAIEDETLLRRLFANDRSSKRLSNPYVGLVSVFDAPDAIRKTRARVLVKEKEDWDAKYIFPLADDRRRKDGAPCMVDSLEEFQKNWSVFSEGSLSQLTDWNNVIAAGGSVLGCLLPLSDEDKESKRTIRKFYHSKAYPTSDVDLFIWGLTPQQAEVKINSIYEAVRDSVPWDVTCIRTKSAITIYSQYPYRCIQIVLRLYQSPAEVLAGFDVDAPCVAYDGSRIYANPRSIVAMMRQANTVDVSRRSPSYEIRLSKYASRGFEIYVPDLRRNDVDPTIFERSLSRIDGLARLLVLERLSDPDTRTSYLESRRALRSRPPTSYSRRMINRQRKRKGDLKAEEEIAGLEMSDYDTAILHIPYGPGWTAKRIDKLIYQTDLGSNSTYNPKNKDRRLHRHSAFFGTMLECMDDCCGYCPEPTTDEEKALQEAEDKNYIRGRIQFIEEDPGRQMMTGSFKPIDIGEWSGQAYLGPTEKFFNAIAAHERETVQRLLQDETLDINRRDPVGRTPLHVAALTKATDICCDLIGAGARMTPRLASGRTVLHIAAQMDMAVVITKLLERSALNEEKAKQAEAEKEAAAKKVEDDGNASDSDGERPSSVDDWTSEDEDDDKRKVVAAAKRVITLDEPAADDGDILEDEMNLPDILDVNAPDWDLRFTPLAFAIVSGAPNAVDALLNAGVDPKQALMPKPNDYNSCTLHPLALATITVNEEAAGAIVDRLLRAGASSSQADTSLFSILHAFVSSGKLSLVEKLLKNDPTSKAAINVPAFNNMNAAYPLVTATSKSQYAMVALLLAYGANVSYSPEEVDKAKKMSDQQRNMHYYYNRNNTPNPLDYLAGVYLPVETSLAAPNYLYQLFVNLGAQINVPPILSHSTASYDQNFRRSLAELTQVCADQVRESLKTFEKKISEAKFSAPENPKTWAEYRLWMVGRMLDIRSSNEARQNCKKAESDAATQNELRLAHFEEAASLLKERNAQGWAELYPDIPRQAKNTDNDASEDETLNKRTQYKLLRSGWGTDMCLPHLLDSYDGLFEACWRGDNAKIQELCLPLAKKSGKLNTSPLQISVKCTGISDKRQPRLLSNDGEHTPLSVAVLARKWDTAKLIMEIAEAQWKKPEKDADATRKFRAAIDLNDEGSDTASDGGSCDTREDSDYEEDEEHGVPSILDLASRPSAVRCDVSPEKFFTEFVSAKPSQDGTKVTNSGKVLLQACYEGDVEAFKQLADICQGLSKPVELPSSGIDTWQVMYGDSVEITDEYIRRTGFGLPIETLSTKVGKEDEDDNEVDRREREAELSKRLYLGLSIHGKKRKDLAKRGDAHAQNQGTSHVPFLWEAIRRQALNIVDYLHSSRPLAAYRAYAQNNTSETADAIRRLSDHELEHLLPLALGLKPNARRETAVTAAILGCAKPLEVTKKLLALNPKHAQDYLHSAIRYVQFTPLLLAAYSSKDTGFVDFLLSHGVATEVTDARGNNIFHIVCANGNLELLQFFLKKLPGDTVARLLQQTTASKHDGLTPLMFAVRNGRLAIVEQLLGADIPAIKASIPTRNARGLNALHMAVQSGLANIVDLLLKHCDEDLLYVENTVGEAPIEIAEMQYILEATRADKFGWRWSISTLNHNEHGRPTAFKRVEEFSKELEGQMVEFRDVKTRLASTGKLTGNAALKKVFDEFESYLVKKVDDVKAFAAAHPTVVGDQTLPVAMSTSGLLFAFAASNVAMQCATDRSKTLAAVLRTAKSADKRSLVHIIDVQRSVINSLDKASAPKDNHPYLWDDNRMHRRFTKAEELPAELGEEKDDSREQWKGVLSWSSSLCAFLG